MPEIKIGKITQQDWNDVKTFFQANPDVTKLDKKLSGITNSFVKVDNEIYAVANRQYFDLLGEGAFGKVRLVENEQGQRFAMKIEARDLRGEEDQEAKIGQMINYIKGQALRKLDRPKRFKGQLINKKLYTVTQLREGSELAKLIYENGNIFKPLKKHDETQRLLIALKACQSIQKLHDLGIIHADIKPANFVANINADMIVLDSIDYGLSLILEQGQDHITSPSRGTGLYMAPELGVIAPDATGKFSFASDVYALGIMLKDDLTLPLAFVKEMIAKQPEDRILLPEMIQKIIQELAAKPSLSADAKEALLEAKKLNELNFTGIVSIQNKDVTKEYHDERKRKTKFGQGKWLSSKAKSVGGHVLGKKNKRTEQLAEIDEMLTLLKTNKELTPPEKAQMAYAVLNEISKQIAKEHNMFASTLKKQCEELKRNLLEKNPDLAKWSENKQNVREKAKEYKQQLKHTSPAVNKPTPKKG